MIRLGAIFVFVFVPVAAYAASSDPTAPEKASLILQSAIAAMQVYLTSKLPGIDKRLTKVETDLSDFIEGVVR